MQLRFKLQLNIAVFLLLGISLYLSLEWQESRENGHRIDLSIGEQHLYGSENTSTYQLIHESIMTGLCWRSHDGIREGIFKDINDGIAQWREKAPGISDRNASVFNHSMAGKRVDHEPLLNELSQLSFEATDFTVSRQTASITGILTIANNRQQIKLDMALPDVQGVAQQDLIELSASTKMHSDQSLQPLSAAQHQIDLCFTVQVARNIDLPDASSGKPLMLSHYY